MKDIKYWVLVSALILGIVFLVMDKCSSPSKVDKLKGEHKKAIEIAKVEKAIKEEIIKKQNKIIKKQDLLIAEANEKVEIKNSHISRLGNTVADLEDEFGNLKDKDAKIANLVSQVSIWKEKFTLAQGIIADKDEIIFSLTKKYESQVIISNSYKTMYKTLIQNTKSLQKIVSAQNLQIKKLRLTSGLKTGIVVTMAIIVAYSLLKD